MLVHTLIVRPYVFLFLIAFLFISIRSRGILKTLLFLTVGYMIALASEALSIKTGFPYGWYSYVYENMRGEFLVLGVPVWDSLSYVFLCYAGMELAEFINSPSPPLKLRGGWGALVKLLLLSALFVTILDIIIDPLANMGEKWFLGNVYDYPEPGFYFGVPLSNFAGWFLVAMVITGSFQLTERCWQWVTRGGAPPPARNSSEHCRGRNAAGPVASAFQSGPLLYFAIFLFNWIITLWIGEWKLALADLFWILIPAILCLRKIRH